MESVCLLMIFHVSQITENVLLIFKITTKHQKRNKIFKLKKKIFKSHFIEKKNCLLKQIEF